MWVADVRNNQESIIHARNILLTVAVVNSGKTGNIFSGAFEGEKSSRMSIGRAYVPKYQDSRAIVLAR